MSNNLCLSIFLKDTLKILFSCSFNIVHLYKVKALLNLNKDLIFIHSVSFLHVYCFHHPSHLKRARIRNDFVTQVSINKVCD